MSDAQPHLLPCSLDWFPCISGSPAQPWVRNGFANAHHTNHYLSIRQILSQLRFGHELLLHAPQEIIAETPEMITLSSAEN
jgi:hypothetical protein